MGMTVEQQQALAMANARLRLSQTPPQQGNMYTQGAEDIQYDPMSGVPLSTSSYGTGTKGGTDYARQALTTTAALPINIATGVAKNVGGLAQTFNRYLGGDQPSQTTMSDLVTGNKPAPKPVGVGEEMLNAINQIEAGTQQQSGSPNLLKGASIVGQVAPYLGTGGRIGTIPSFVNTAKNVGQGALIGGASALASPEEIGLTPEQFREAKNKNIGIQTAIGGAFPIAGELVSKTVNALRGTKLTPQMQNAVSEARNLGYTLPPTQAGGGFVSQALEGIAGKLSTAQEASVRNQGITNKLAAKSLGLAEDTILTPDLIKSVRKEAGQAYENLKLSGTVKTSPKFVQALDEIKPYQDAIQAAKDFPEELANPIIKIVDSLKRPNFDVNSAVSKINLLRNDADKAFRSGDTALAKANKDASQVLENTIENHLANTKQTQLLDKFREARQLIAKSYEVEKAMNAVTGSVNAQKLAGRLQAGKPLSSELKDVAKFGLAFPKASQMPEKVGGALPFSPLDMALATTTGGGALLGGEGYGSSGAVSLATLLARPAARKAVLSNRMQNKLIQQQATPAGAISQALPSSDEAQQLAKMLIMQQSGSTSENRK
jgi:hypothetical protein